MFGLCLALLSANGPCGPMPCLPGIDSIGIGFDAVKGTSLGVGRPVVFFNFSEGKTYSDPFENRTLYAVPNSMTISTDSTQFMGHHVWRDVTSSVHQQSRWANVDVHAGFFSSSVQTNDASTTMSDGVHILIESRSQVTLYVATLDMPSLLPTDSKFQAAIDALPATYDPDRYGEIVKYYGTHFVSVAEFGGLARMRTVVKHSYYSRTSDSELHSQAAIQWGMFGGGGGGGSSQHDTSQEWKDNAQSSTFVQGGDPAIRSFSSNEQWTKWAQSVEQSAPTQTQYQLQDLSSVVTDPMKATNLKKAIFDYAVAHNASWPGADLTKYQMGWCDCHDVKMQPYSVGTGQQFVDNCAPASEYADVQCPDGFVATRLQGIIMGSDHLYGLGTCWKERRASSIGLSCCRPCFTASSSSSVKALKPPTK